DDQLVRVRDGVLRDADRLRHAAGEAVGDDLFDALAVGYDLDAALDGVGHLRAGGLDGQRLEAEPAGLDGEAGRRDLALLSIERRAQAAAIDQLDPGFRL